MEKLAAFLLYLARQKNLHDGGIRRHQRSFRYLSKHTSFKPKKIDSFFLELKQRGCKNTYINSLINTVRVFGQFTKNKQLAKYPFWRKEPFVKATMSDEEIEAFLALPPDKREVTHPRTGKIFYRRCNPRLYKIWTLFFSIMAYTGMRPGEVANLTVDDVDFGRGVFTLVETKTGNPRYVPCPPNIEKAVLGHVQCVRSVYLFASANGGKKDGKAVFDNADWHYNFHTRLKRLGIKRTNLTPYSLRHSFATRMIEENVNIFLVQKLLGHRRLDTTAQYIHLTTKDICNAIKKHPLIRKHTDPMSTLQSIKELIDSFELQNDHRFSYISRQTEKSLKIVVQLIKEECP